MAAPSPPPSEIPVTLWAQFLRQLPRYGVGMLLLAAYQAAQYWFDTRLMRAIDWALAGERSSATWLGFLLIAVALGSFVIRVLSRVAVFNGGRIAEYELRRALLHRLQSLGPSFYRKMSTGEIMSRVTNDLTQVRLLLGFGILNVINTLFALASALTVTLSMSWKLTLASLATLPILLLVTPIGAALFDLDRAAVPRFEFRLTWQALAVTVATAVLAFVVARIAASRGSRSAGAEEVILRDG